MAARNTTRAAALRTLERQAGALDLRRAGLTFDEIGGRLGVCRSMAYKLVRQGMQQALAEVAESAGELRALELSRLDGLLETVWPLARRGDLAAVDRVLKIMERRARLLGLDAPVKVAETDPLGESPGPRTILLVAPPVGADGRAISEQT